MRNKSVNGKLVLVCHGVPSLLRTTASGWYCIEHKKCIFGAEEKYKSLRPPIGPKTCHFIDLWPTNVTY